MLSHQVSVWLSKVTHDVDLLTGCGLLALHAPLESLQMSPRICGGLRCLK